MARPQASKNTSKSAKPRAAKLSPVAAPDDIPTEQWQVALRREFGQAQHFILKNLGGDPLFSDFSVINPTSGGHYIVNIRGASLGANHCTCPDFSTNTLGTCKHIEFTLATLEKKRGAKKRLAAGFIPAYSEVAIEYGEHRHISFHPGSEAKASLLKLAGRYFQEKNQWRLPPERYSEFDVFLHEALQAGHNVRIRDDAATLLAQQRDTQQRIQRVDRLFPQGADSKKLQTLLNTKLYPYQAEGILFAVKAGRCLIGDEMGLGKTIQAIGAATVLTEHFNAERILVVCPTSLKHQWEKEIQRFSGMTTVCVQGPRHVRETQFGSQSACKIINYELLRRDVDLIKAWAPDILIIDEAQRVKNWNTLAARALRQFETPYTFVLTGTPLENKLEELIALVQLVDRYRLGALWRIRQEHQVKDENGRLTGYRALDKIAQALAPIMIRRRKADVLQQLPDRIEQTLFMPMSPRQLAYHQENNDIVAQIVARWKRTKYLTEADQRRLTCALQNMRMACNSSYLLDKQTRDGAKLTELVTLLEEILEDPDAKVVVFSQWLRMHELIAEQLQAQGWGHVLFHGGVPSNKRGALTEQFQNDAECRVFLSTEAGASGLNLQHASTVINIDLPWNPAVLSQRIARVHRLGQKNVVQVINLVAQGTIEEGMLSLLSFKKSLADGILDGGNSEVFLKGSRLTQFMESVSSVASSMEKEGPPQTDDATPPTADDLLHNASIQATNASSQSADVMQQSANVMQQSADVMQRATDSVPPLSGNLSPTADSVAGPETGQPQMGVPTSTLSGLLGLGLNFLEQLASTQTGTGPTPSWITQDPNTGERYLKLSLPQPEVMDQLAGALRKALTAFER